MVAGMLFGANIATADSVWVQSYERTSQTEACAAQPGETPWQASWGTDSSWSPSWEMWANSGNGGWVCTRSITWARTPVDLTPVTPVVTCTEPVGGAVVDCAVGKIGPGEGLVFYIDSVSGLRYEMAPTNWNDPTNPTGVDPTKEWITNASTCYATNSSVADQNCQSNNLYPETTSGAQTASTTGSEAIGMGSVNTAAIKDRMFGVDATLYAAGLASAYRGGGFTDWFLPSEDELNAMCNYSRNLSASPDPTVSCYGGSGTSQDGTFAGGDYGFASGRDFYYWSSSQKDRRFVWSRILGDGFSSDDAKGDAMRVRPVRAF